jgi:hypothetical protein
VDPAFVVSDCSDELFVGLELVEWVRVKGEVQKLFRGVTGFESVLDELVKQCGLPDITAPNECEYGLIFELAASRTRTREMVEITFLPGREIEGIASIIPPRVVLVEGLDEGVASIDRHWSVGWCRNAIAMIVTPEYSPSQRRFLRYIALIASLVVA